MGCYDYRVEKKRIELLAKLYEDSTGEKTLLVEHLTGTKRWYTFEVIVESSDKRDLKD